MTDAAIQKASKRRHSRRKDENGNAGTVEIEIGGRKVNARKQTVPTGAGSITHFVSKLFD